MPKTINIAAVQMDAAPAPTDERLERAELLVTAAAQTDAQLVLLPELFNTGYAYSDANHELAETLDGPTASWMEDAAIRLNVHLAGSLMVRERSEIYNAMLLFAPDGRMWRYDKTYPWGWERGYFRGGDGPVVADTDLGRIGMLVCWDVGHTHLWRAYAGRVDLMVIAGCPPDFSNPTFHLPSGVQLTYDDLGPVFSSLKGEASRVFGDMIDEQAAWLGVPAVNTVGSGHICTPIPNGRGTLLAFATMAPRLLKHLPHAGALEVSADMVDACKIVGADGQALAARSQAEGEGFVTAAVTLADEPPQPSGEQPPTRASLLSRLSSDVLLTTLALPTYRRGVRRAWHCEVAPPRLPLWSWGVLVGVAAVAGFLLGILIERKRKTL
ncbi:MAG: carbon-nitrogen hydrolase family protein [Anaerolineae bacterium]|nr:carbon-nitrogen hydrolase family protein [Anaerolineae bacterium]